MPGLVVHNQNLSVCPQHASILHIDPSPEISRDTAPDLHALAQMDLARNTAVNTATVRASLVVDNRRVPLGPQRALARQIHPSSTCARNTAPDLCCPSQIDHAGRQGVDPPSARTGLIAHNRHALLYQQPAFTLQVDPSSICACHTAPDLHPLSHVVQARVRTVHAPSSITSLVAHNQHLPRRHQRTFMCQENTSPVIVRNTAPDLDSLPQINQAR
eukprot:3934496-Rhodomonas_salina.1